MTTKPKPIFRNNFFKTTLVTHKITYSQLAAILGIPKITVECWGREVGPMEEAEFRKLSCFFDWLAGDDLQKRDQYWDGLVKFQRSLPKEKKVRKRIPNVKVNISIPLPVFNYIKQSKGISAFKRGLIKDLKTWYINNKVN